MSGTKALSGSALALRNVFMLPIESNSRRYPLQCLSPAFRRYTALSNQRLNQAFQHYQQSRTVYTGVKAQPVQRSPRDEEIKAPFVALVSPEGKLQPPQDKLDVLSSMDRVNEVLVLVNSPGNGVPICRIFNKKALREAEKTKDKKAADPGNTIKTIELNWAIDGNDLSHRLEKVRGFLSKGYKVEIAVAPKRRGRKATLEQAQDLIRRVKECIDSVEGASEWKPMTGEVMRHTTIYAKANAPR